MTFGVANIDRATLINNVTLLAKVAKEFGVPTVLDLGGDRELLRLHLAAAARRLPGPAGGRAHLDELVGRRGLPRGHRGDRAARTSS